MTENISINGFLSTWEPGPIETDLLSRSLEVFLDSSSDAKRYLPASYKPAEALKYAIQHSIGKIKLHSRASKRLLKNGCFKVERNRDHHTNGYELDFTYRHNDVNQTVTLLSAKVDHSSNRVDVTYSNDDTPVTDGWGEASSSPQWQSILDEIQKHYESALTLSPAINISKRLIDWCMDKCSAIDPPNVRGVRWVHNKYEDVWQQFSNAVNAASSQSQLDKKPRILSLGLKATPDSFEMLSNAALVEIQNETNRITLAIQSADGSSSNQILKNHLDRCEMLYERASDLSSMLNSNSILDQCNSMVRKAQQAITIAAAQVDANEVTGSETSNPFSYV